MKIPRVPHRWRVTPKEAMAIQKRLAATVRHTPPATPLRFIAGADAAFSKDARLSFAAVVLWDLQEQVVVEERMAVRELTFPYVPGLLSFREAPSILAALRKLRRTPDALMLDGHGWAHPRRFGIACHVGVICNLPTIGCAKSRLTGTHGELAARRGCRIALSDGADVIGAVLRTRDGVRPVYVSVGHEMDLPTAEKTVLDCAIRYRLPEPTRLADRAVAAFKVRSDYFSRTRKN